MYYSWFAGQPSVNVIVVRNEHGTGNVMRQCGFRPGAFVLATGLDWQWSLPDR